MHLSHLSICPCRPCAGDSERKIQKASSGTGADTVCLDLEDAVAANRKQAARDIVTQALACELAAALDM